MTMLLLRNLLGWLNYPARGGVSRAAKGADCKSAASWLRRFESYLPHQPGFGGQRSVLERRNFVSILIADL